MGTGTKTRTTRTRGDQKKTPYRKTSQTPRSLAIADRGIKTGSDFADMMSALMSDLVAGRVTPQIGNATCNAGGKLLKIVDMQYKYGTTGDEKGRQRRTLVLALDQQREQINLTESNS